MGYMHIDNLYKAPEFLTGPDEWVYVLEKIHGTSAHVAYHKANDELRFFSGGEKHENFVKLFNADFLRSEMRIQCEKLGVESLTVYGEAYGGKQQGMKDTYGPNLAFVAFDVLAGGVWLQTHEAALLAVLLGFDFVWYTKCQNKIEELDRYRDQESQQAIRNGMGQGKISEGIVIRPLEERSYPNGKRVIYKHKRKEFCETKKPREVSLDRIEVLKNAQAIADEWVTEMRLTHVLGRLAADRIQEKGQEAIFQPCDTPLVIRAMFEDVRREAEGEIEWSKEAERSVGQRTAKLFKDRLAREQADRLVASQRTTAPV